MSVSDAVRQRRAGWRAYCKGSPYSPKDYNGQSRSEDWRDGWKMAESVHKVRGSRPNANEAKEHLPTPRDQAKTFNSRVDVGATVTYWTGMRPGPYKISKTSTRATVLGDHTAVVRVEDHPTFLALDNVEIGDAILEENRTVRFDVRPEDTASTTYTGTAYIKGELYTETEGLSMASMLAWMQTALEAAPRLQRDEVGRWYIPSDQEESP